MIDWYSDGIQGFEWFRIIFILICLIVLGYIIYATTRSIFQVGKTSSWKSAFIIGAIFLVMLILSFYRGQPPQYL
jgi:TRAP-type uncharacterized transport system fused permease subunit